MSVNHLTIEQALLEMGLDDDIYDFIEKISELLDDLVDRRVDHFAVENFGETIAGDWSEENIKNLLDELRKQAEDPSDVDLVITYLFADLLDRGDVVMSATSYEEPETESIVGIDTPDINEFVGEFVGVTCELGHCSVLSERASLGFRLKAKA